MIDEHPLLSLQAVDSAADGLTANRAGLPQRAALEACAAERQKIEADIAAVEASEVELRATERGLAREVAESVREGREAEDKLYSGKVQGVAELEGLQTQLDSFRAKQAELEERQLGLMETREELEQGLAGGTESLAACDAKREELLAALAEGESTIDAQLVAVAAERDEAIARVPPASLQNYDRLRKSARLGGVVTAQVKGNACGRCRIPVPVMRLTRVREDAVGDVVRCENCNRILVP